MPTDEQRIRVRFARDLSTRTEEEVAGIWTGRNLRALEKVAPGRFDSCIRNHNPIYFLALQAWFDNDPTLLWEPFHRDQICKELLEFYLEPKGKHAGLIILAQRDSFKTTFSHGVFAQFISLRMKEVEKKDVRIGICHHAENMAMENLTLLKSKSYGSPWIRQVWPEFASEDDWDSSKKFNWPCKEAARIKDPSVRAFSNKSSKTGGHMDWKLNDDLVTEDHIDSKVIREAAHLNYHAGRDLIDTKVGKELNTGTFYHTRDLWNKLVESGKYRVLIIQGGGTDVGKPLSFPTRHTQAFLDEKRSHEKATRGNDMMYWLQYQLEPRTKSLVATEMDWLKYCDYDTVREDVADRFGIVITVDPAWKGTKNAGMGDYAAIAVNGLEIRGVLMLHYLLDLTYSNEMTSHDGMAEIFRLMAKWNTSDVAPEEHGGHTFRTDLEQEALKRGTWINLIDLKSKQRGKQERIVTFLNHVQAGHFFIADTCDASPFLSEYEDYPQVDHDDALDGVAYAWDPNVRELFTPRYGQGWAAPQQDEPRTRHCTV